MSIPIYHITAIDNLSSIMSEGLIAKNFHNNLNYRSIANENIQYRRNYTPVPCRVGGNLHDYVPFYFCPRSPMLYTIHKGNVSSYQDGQKSIIHLVVDAEEVDRIGLKYVFTDGHATINYTEFFDAIIPIIDNEPIRIIDHVLYWETIESNYWFNTENDPDRKRRKQAEFLIHRRCPWDLIQEIGVINHEMKQKVETILQTVNDQTSVKVYSHWYYQH